MARWARLARSAIRACQSLASSSLLNVATRAVLTAPGPLNLIHSEVLNTALATFPFTFIPGFMAPLAGMLHVLSIRALPSWGRGGPPGVRAKK